MIWLVLPLMVDGACEAVPVTSPEIPRYGYARFRRGYPRDHTVITKAAKGGAHGCRPRCGLVVEFLTRPAQTHLAARYSSITALSDDLIVTPFGPAPIRVT